MNSGPGADAHAPDEAVRVSEAPGDAAEVTDSPGADSDGAGFAAAQSRRVALGGGQLDQLMPVVLFLVFYNLEFAQVAGLNNIEVAVIAATAWSIKAAYSRVRRGLPIGKWLPAITGYLVARAGVSIAVERDLVDFGVSPEAVYFGIGIGTKMLVGLAAAATILVGKPFVLWVVRRFVPLPEAVLGHRSFVATLRNVTWVIAFYEVGSSIWDIWLYNNAGVSQFVIIRFLGNYAASFVLIFGTLIYADRRFAGIDGCPSLVELVSQATKRRAKDASLL